MQAIRLGLAGLASDHQDYAAYQHVFAALIGKASAALTALWHALERERSSIEDVRDFMALRSSGSLR